jgi:hypothetical protein
MDGLIVTPVKRNVTCPACKEIIKNQESGMSAQKPSLGRIVIVPVNPGASNGATEAPAIITRVWDNGLINLKTVPDGPAGTTEEWRTSITLYATEEEAREEAQNRFSAAWWPPRV